MRPRAQAAYSWLLRLASICAATAASAQTSLWLPFYFQQESKACQGSEFNLMNQVQIARAEDASAHCSSCTCLGLVVKMLHEKDAWQHGHGDGDKAADAMLTVLQGLDVPRQLS